MKPNDIAFMIAVFIVPQIYLSLMLLIPFSEPIPEFSKNITSLMFFMALIAITSYSFIFSIINLMTLEQSDYYKNHLFTVTFCGTVFAVLFCVVLPIAIGCFPLPFYMTALCYASFGILTLFATARFYKDLKSTESPDEPLSTTPGTSDIKNILKLCFCTNAVLFSTILQSSLLMIFILIGKDLSSTQETFLGALLSMFSLVIRVGIPHLIYNVVGLPFGYHSKPFILFFTTYTSTLWTHLAFPFVKQWPTLLLLGIIDVALTFFYAKWLYNPFAAWVLSEPFSSNPANSFSVILKLFCLIKQKLHTGAAKIRNAKELENQTRCRLPPNLSIPSLTVKTLDKHARPSMPSQKKSVFQIENIKSVHDYEAHIKNNWMEYAKTEFFLYIWGLVSASVTFITIFTINTQTANAVYYPFPKKDSYSTWMTACLFSGCIGIAQVLSACIICSINNRYRKDDEKFHFFQQGLKVLNSFKHYSFVIGTISVICAIQFLLFSKQSRTFYEYYPSVDIFPYDVDMDMD